MLPLCNSRIRFRVPQLVLILQIHSTAVLQQGTNTDSPASWPTSPTQPRGIPYLVRVAGRWASHPRDPFARGFARGSRALEAKRSESCFETRRALYVCEPIVHEAIHVKMVAESSHSSELSRRNVCGRHGEHCNTCLGDDFHPSRCTTPSETKMAGSAWEPVGHSMCTSDAWRHRDSMEHEPWRRGLVRSCWTHDGHWTPDLILSRLVACRSLPTIGNMSSQKKLRCPCRHIRKIKKNVKMSSCSAHHTFRTPHAALDQRFAECPLS